MFHYFGISPPFNNEISIGSSNQTPFHFWCTQTYISCWFFSLGRPLGISGELPHHQFVLAEHCKNFQLELLKISHCHKLMWHFWLRRVQQAVSELSEATLTFNTYYDGCYSMLMCLLPPGLAGWLAWRGLPYCRVGDSPQWDYTDARFTGALNGGRLCAVCIPRYRGKGSAKTQGKNWAQVAWLMQSVWVWEVAWTAGGQPWWGAWLSRPGHHSNLERLGSCGREW